jgi:hypothetical protein
MTFLSSRVIGRGAAAPPAVDALITDAFLLFCRYRLASDDAWVTGWQDAPPIAAVAADAREGAGAMPQGTRRRDARDSSISQQQIKLNEPLFKKPHKITKLSLYR